MILAYSMFTLVWLLPLFTERTGPGATRMLTSVGAMTTYSRLRNRKIQSLGFSHSIPFPSQWSEELHDRDPEVFKGYILILDPSVLGLGFLEIVDRSEIGTPSASHQRHEKHENETATESKDTPAHPSLDRRGSFDFTAAPPH